MIRFKKIVRRLRRKLLFLRNSYSPRIRSVPGIVFLGTEYGGWPIISDLVHSASQTLSFGLGKDISFDLQLIERFDSVVHGFDPTPRSKEWIESQSLPEKFCFHPIGLASRDGVLTFNAPVSPSFASYSTFDCDNGNDETVSLPVERLSTIMSRLKLQEIHVLKMDIEGSEVEVIEDLASGLIRPTQILVEFHHRMHRSSFAITKQCIQTLESLGYILFYVSDIGDEYCFVLGSAIQ